jgi:hypothetical protein
MFYQASVTVLGGNGDDDILLSANAGFPAWVWGNGGDDRIVLTGGGIASDGFDYANWSHPVVVHGGAGDDEIELHSLHDKGDSKLASAVYSATPVTTALPPAQPTINSTAVPATTPSSAAMAVTS